MPFIHFVFLSTALQALGALAAWQPVTRNVLERMVRRLERGAAATGRGPASYGLVFGLPILIQALLAAAWGVPQPREHDEFAYLLMADTFSLGRLTNPAHPLWRSFDTFHVLQQPSYMGKYPVGQALALAVGQLFGMPIAGVWLSTGAACAAVLWALRAWLPPRWALVGGVIAGLFPALVVWAQGYWGGAMAVLGGALLLGSLRRLVDRPASSDGLVLGLGLAVLANTRPAEGALLAAFSIVAATAVVWRRGRPGIGELLRRGAAPLLAVLLPSLAFMAYYNGRVTGDPLSPPYVAYMKAHDVVPPYVWMAERQPPQANSFPELASHNRRYLEQFRQQQASPIQWLNKFRLEFLYLSPLVVSPLLLVLLPGTLAGAPARVLAGVLAAFLAATAAQTYMLPHYLAPALPALLVLYVLALRRLRPIRLGGRRVGRIVAGVAVSSLALAPLLVATSSQRGAGWQRKRHTERLEREPGRDVVFVRYGPTHETSVELVYNGADVDAAPVVWARDLDCQQNLLVRSYYHDRTAWLLDLSHGRGALEAYPGPGECGPAASPP